jgi:hypothetical protein
MGNIGKRFDVNVIVDTGDHCKTVLYSCIIAEGLGTIALLI